MNILNSTLVTEDEVFSRACRYFRCGGIYDRREVEGVENTTGRPCYVYYYVRHGDGQHGRDESALNIVAGMLWKHEHAVLNVVVDGGVVERTVIGDRIEQNSASGLAATTRDNKRPIESEVNQPTTPAYEWPVAKLSEQVQRALEASRHSIAPEDFREGHRSGVRWLEGLDASLPEARVGGMWECLTRLADVGLTWPNQSLSLSEVRWLFAFHLMRYLKGSWDDNAEVEELLGATVGWRTPSRWFLMGFSHAVREALYESRFRHDVRNNLDNPFA